MIEIQGRSAGIVVGLRGGFMFFAADPLFKALERRVFKQVAQAEYASFQLLGKYCKCNRL